MHQYTCIVGALYHHFDRVMWSRAKVIHFLFCYQVHNLFEFTNVYPTRTRGTRQALFPF